MNRIVIDGYLTKEPEIKNLPSGTTVANFRIGSPQGRQDGQNENLWIDCELFGERANKLAAGLTKGSYVLLDGKLRQRQWEQDGEKKTRLTLTVDMIYRLDGRPQEQEPKDEVPF